MEEEKIHIGSLVEKAFNQSKKTKTEFANAIGIANQNLNREFKKKDWSVIKLIRAGQFLNYDFSGLFVIGEPVKAKPKVLLQIEIEDEKVNDVLKVVSNNDLYNIIKR